MACRMCHEIMFYERTAFRFVCRHVYLENKITLILSLYEYINWIVEIRKVLDFFNQYDFQNDVLFDYHYIA